jgi:hypothetical protein
MALVGVDWVAVRKLRAGPTNGLAGGGVLHACAKLCKL